MPIDFNCPTCGKLLRVPDDSAGKQARCPHCGDVASIPVPIARQPLGGDPFGFQPPTAGGTFRPDESNPFASPTAAAGALPLDAYRNPETARARVFGPALSLLILSPVALLIALGFAANAIWVLTNRNFGGKPEDVGFIIGFCLPYAFALTLPILVFYGAWQMKNLRRYGMAMTGVILALLPCNCLFFLTIPFGIWALIVLLSDEVKWAFEQNRGR